LECRNGNADAITGLNKVKGIAMQVVELTPLRSVFPEPQRFIRFQGVQVRDSSGRVHIPLDENREEVPLSWECSHSELEPLVEPILRELERDAVRGEVGGYRWSTASGRD
jgi:hypothetical protein